MPEDPPEVFCGQDDRSFPETEFLWAQDGHQIHVIPNAPEDLTAESGHATTGERARFSARRDGVGQPWRLIPEPPTVVIEPDGFDASPAAPAPDGPY